MEAKKLEIQTLSVQIKVLTIDQKRFTKSVFDQLPYFDPVCCSYVEQDDEGELHSKEFSLCAPIIGHVKIKDEGFLKRIGLCVFTNTLYKCYCMEGSEEEYYLQRCVEKSEQLFISI